MKHWLEFTLEERDGTSAGRRSVRYSRRREAFAMRQLQYRNGFKLIFRNRWPSSDWRPRIVRECPWWAFPRCKAVSYERFEKLRQVINRKRVA